MVALGATIPALLTKSSVAGVRLLIWANRAVTADEFEMSALIKTASQPWF
jgi:hypothetical protein